jgi:hypothetical protein
LGKRGVAHVIQNRADDPWWRCHDVHSVILKPWQFNAADPGDSSFQDCANICEAVAAGRGEDLTSGATPYYDISIQPPNGPQMEATYSR